MRKWIAVISGLAIVFAGVLLFNTIRFTTKPVTVEKIEIKTLDADRIVDRLSKAVQIPTISQQMSSMAEFEPFEQFVRLLQASFPKIHSRLELHRINKYSLVYRWPGKNNQLKPLALLAHMDVVPAGKDAKKVWKAGPFSGRVENGFVWGRGTLDDKNSLMAIMEAVENLLETGFSPDRDVYLLFGHDEEMLGNQGAKQIAAYLEDRHIRFAFTLDEGMVVLDPDLSPSGRELAVIGISEKGYLTLKLNAKGEGGHASMPGPNSAIGRLSRALVKLEENRMPATLSGPIGELFNTIGPDMPFLKKMLFANQWISKPLLLKVLGRKRTTNAMIRTTTALTMINGGVKENVLPQDAQATVNFRILPGDSQKQVIEHVRKVMDDPAIEIIPQKGAAAEPSLVSSTTSAAFLALKKTVGEIFGRIRVAPGLVPAGTDSRHYQKISDNCYRFMPVVFGPEDTPRIHGPNERISIAGYLQSIRFYSRLIENTAKKDGKS